MHEGHDDTSEALLLAAHRLLSEHGAEALTVRRIATEAGMSTMNVYSRFGGKDGVVDELYVNGFRRLSADLSVVPRDDDFAVELMQMATAYRQFAVQNPNYYRVMFRTAIPDYSPSPSADDVALGTLDQFIDRIEVARAHGSFIPPTGTESPVVAAWFWATVHGMVSLEVDGVAVETVPWSTIFEQGIAIAISGLRPAISS